MNTPNLINANSLHIPLADQSVQMVATSPPYFALRSYATGTNKAHELGAETLHDCAGWATGNDCGGCYICNLRAWAREVYRVLRNDGTFWLNLGDSYAGSGGAGGDYNEGGLRAGQPRFPGTQAVNKAKDRTTARWGGGHKSVKGLLAKNLMGIPWRAALALQSDGWILRSDIVWSKSNPMPSSAEDRCAVSHEYIFMFSKRKKYFYDNEAIKEISRGEWEFDKGKREQRLTATGGALNGGVGNGTGIHTTRNRRTVWDVATYPYSSGADVDHFAAWPPTLVEPMIKAGTSAAGFCPTCKTPWKRIIEKESRYEKRQERAQPNGKMPQVDSSGWWPPQISDKGFSPNCDCPELAPLPCIVLDPFCGSGTTGLVSRQLGRTFIGLDLSYAYLTQCARPRLSLTALDEWTRGKAAPVNGYHELPLFQAVQP